MKQNVFDAATDKLKARLQQAQSIVRTQFKNTKPYRQEPVSAKERIYQYYHTDIPLMRQMFGDDAVDEYERNIQSLIRRQGNA